MKALKNFHQNAEDKSKNEEENEESEERSQLLVFLWSMQNNRMSKVSLHEPPENELFDSLAQEVMRKLDKKENPTEGEPKENEKATTDWQQKSSGDSPSDSPVSLLPSSSRSSSPTGRPRNSEDRTQSKKATHGSPDGPPLAKSLFQGRERGRNKRVSLG